MKTVISTYMAGLDSASSCTIQPRQNYHCSHLQCLIIGPQHEKTCLWGFANNTGADQPAHPRSLISAFVIRFLVSIISRLATSEISIFKLVSVAEETGLKLALSETPKTGFLATRPILCKGSGLKFAKATDPDQTAV